MVDPRVLIEQKVMGYNLHLTGQQETNTFASKLGFGIMNQKATYVRIELNLHLIHVTFLKRYPSNLTRELIQGRMKVSKISDPMISSLTRILLHLEFKKFAEEIKILAINHLVGLGLMSKHK